MSKPLRYKFKQNTTRSDDLWNAYEELLRQVIVRFPPGNPHFIADAAKKVVTLKKELLEPKLIKSMGGWDE